MTETEKKEVVTEETTTQELAAVLTDIVEAEPSDKDKKRRIKLIDDLVMIDQRQYRLVTNYREAFDIDKINERYSDVLNRYDYIVGDLGFEQLRLKGFFSDHQKKMPVEHRIGSLQDYLYEYCNFGCGYYVLEKVGIGSKKEKPQNRNKRNNRKNKPAQQPKQPAHTQEKIGKTSEKTIATSNKKAPVIKNRRENEKATQPRQSKEQPKQEGNQGAKRNFTIRQKDE